MNDSNVNKSVSVYVELRDMSHVHIYRVCSQRDTYATLHIYLAWVLQMQSERPRCITLLFKQRKRAINQT